MMKERLHLSPAVLWLPLLLAESSRNGCREFSSQWALCGCRACPGHQHALMIKPFGAWGTHVSRIRLVPVSISSYAEIGVAFHHLATSRLLSIGAGRYLKQIVKQGLETFD